MTAHFQFPLSTLHFFISSPNSTFSLKPNIRGVNKVSHIFLAILIVLIIGIIVGAVLSAAAVIFAVPVDKKAAEISELLPGANCGACGFSGCSGYAAALSKGEAKLGLCSVGGQSVVDLIAPILGAEGAEITPKTAFVRCSGDLDNTSKIGEYEGIRSCAAAKQLHGGMGKCTYGCIGFGDCVSVCEYNAISIQNGVAEVDSDKCKACSACVNVCPQNIITIEPKTPHPIVKCSNCDKGAYTRKVCKTGCIGCMKCMKVCEYGAITIENNLSRIDRDKCTGCMKCVEVCPSSILNSQFAMRNADRAKTNN